VRPASAYPPAPLRPWAGTSATLDGAVRHKEQVVAAALAAHPDGERPVLIGDRSHDVLGARAHGLPCIGAGWGPAPPGELAAAGAVAVARSPTTSLRR
jgi:phosphoglycolate phosphatase